MLIRPIRASDSQSFLDLLHALDSETSFMMLEPGERNTTATEQEGRIRNLLSQPNQMILVAEGEGELAGYVLAEGGEFRRNRRTAYIVAGVRQSHAGRGLGSRLFAEIEAWAVQTGIHRLELTVMTHNQRAVALYQRMGFQIEGVKKDSLLVGGAYVDEYYMAKILAGLR